MTDSPISRRASHVVLSAVRQVDPDGSKDTEARFRVIFETGFDYIWNAIRRLGVAPSDLEDISHDVLLDVYRKIDTYDPERPLKPWLFAFSFRAASEYRRRRRVRGEVSESVEVVDTSPLVEERLVEHENRALVAAALESLDLDRRAVFVLHDLDDVAVPEIARALDIPLNTAYSRLRVARERFVKAITRLRGQEVR
jgi:RNA polymerase sigma-70 factor (ECF subfamily)